MIDATALAIPDRLASRRAVRAAGRPRRHPEVAQAPESQGGWKKPPLLVSSEK